MNEKLEPRRDAVGDLKRHALELTRAKSIAKEVAMKVCQELKLPYSEGVFHSLTGDEIFDPKGADRMQEPPSHRLEAYVSILIPHVNRIADGNISGTHFDNVFASNAKPVPGRNPREEFKKRFAEEYTRRLTDQLL